MSHKEQLDFVHKVKEKYKKHFIDKCVVEIGSLNINGSVRKFFEKCVYIGVDVGPGPGVDVVCLGHEYHMPDNSFDVSISCECFEHDPYYIKTFENMVRLAKSGGLVVFSCATTGRKIHGTKQEEPQSSPLTVNLGWDYYKNLEEEDFTQKMNFDSLFSEYEFSKNTDSFDLYFYGIKR
jgi:SAM-dependent methyltransferase